MIRHMIFIFLDPKSTRRIAYKISSSQVIDSSMIPQKIKELMDEYNIYAHLITTDSYEFSSVFQMDEFFKGIELVDTPEEFEKEIIKILDKSALSPLDMARFILAEKSFDKLEIQKLIYFIYCFSLKEGIKLFTTPPLAYKYGPVYQDIYDAYKSYPSKEKIKVLMTLEEKLRLSSQMGKRVLGIIGQTLKDLEGKTGSELIDLTHIKGGPWYLVYEQGKNNPITDDLILNSNHLIEQGL